MKDDEIEIWKQAIKYRLGDLNRRSLIFNIGIPQKGDEFLRDFDSLLQTGKKISGRFLDRYLLGIVKREMDRYVIRILGNNRIVRVLYSALGNLEGSIKLSEIERINASLNGRVLRGICRIISISVITIQETVPVETKYPKELIKEMSNYLNKTLKMFCKGKIGNKYKDLCARLVSELKAAIEKQLDRAKGEKPLRYKMLRSGDGIALWLGNTCAGWDNLAKVLDDHGVTIDKRHDIIVYPINHLPIVRPFLLSQVRLRDEDMTLFIVSPVTEMYSSRNKKEIEDLRKQHCIAAYHFDAMLTLHSVDSSYQEYLRSLMEFMPGFDILKISRRVLLDEIIGRR